MKAVLLLSLLMVSTFLIIIMMMALLIMFLMVLIADKDFKLLLIIIPLEVQVDSREFDLTYSAWPYDVAALMKISSCFQALAL